MRWKAPGIVMARPFTNAWRGTPRPLGQLSGCVRAWRGAALPFLVFLGLGLWAGGVGGGFFVWANDPPAPQLPHAGSVPGGKRLSTCFFVAVSVVASWSSLTYVLLALTQGLFRVACACRLASLGQSLWHLPQDVGLAARGSGALGWLSVAAAATGLHAPTSSACGCLKSELELDLDSGQDYSVDHSVE